MLDVADSTSPERAREIQLRLRRPQNAVQDHGIDLSRKGTFAVKSRDDNLFFVPNPTPPSTRFLERLKAESQGIVPNNWPSDQIILHAKCGASFLLVPSMTVANQQLCAQSKIIRATITEVLQALSQATGFHIRDIISDRRTADIVVPRQFGMYLAKRLTLKSLPQIGRRFGGRDHTTVVHSVRKLAWLDRLLNLPDESTVQQWAAQGWALVQEHGAKGPQP